MEQSHIEKASKYPTTLKKNLFVLFSESLLNKDK